MKARYGQDDCPECGGSRLRKEALYVRIGGRNIADLVVMPVDELIVFFNGLQLDEHDTKTAARILIEIRSRLQYLTDVGPGYLTLDRLSSTCRAARASASTSTSLGSNLTACSTSSTNPRSACIRDTNRHQGAQTAARSGQHGDRRRARGRGDPRRLHRGHRSQKAGYGGGGGFQRYAAALLKTKSLTADYLTGRRAIARRRGTRMEQFDRHKSARENNLRNIDVRIPWA